MGFNIEPLKGLQEIDKKIYDLREDQKRIPLEIKENDDKVNAQQKSVQEAEERAKESKLILSKCELALQEKEEQIKKYDAQLSQIKTNKEYSALQGEIKNIQADNSVLEEEIIKELDTVQSIEDRFKKERDMLKSIEEERTSKKKELDTLLQQNKEIIASLQNKREGFLKEINAEDLSIYERILNAKDGVALAQVINDTCGVCRMNLLQQTINEVMMSDKIVFCGTCHRILFIQTVD